MQRLPTVGPCISPLFFVNSLLDGHFSRVCSVIPKGRLIENWLFVVTLSLCSILRRCFVAWHVLASTRVTNRRNVVLFGERRLLVMVRRKLFFKCYFSKDMKSTATVRLPLHLRDLVTVHSCCVNLCFQETRRTYGFSVSLSLWTKSFGVTIQLKAL